MSDMDAYRDVFLAESADFLQQITDGLLDLERDPTYLAPVEIVFRGAHSLKGMAAAMGYERTADLTHKMEGLMDRVRKGDLKPDQPVIDLMLAASDVVRELIDDESNGRSAVDPSDVIAALEAATAGVAAQSAAPPAAPGESADEPVDQAGGPTPDEAAQYDITVRLEESCVLKAVRAYMVIKRLSHIGRVVDTVPSGREIEDEEFEREFKVILASNASPAAIGEAAEHVSEVEQVTVVEKSVAPRQSATPAAPAQLSPRASAQIRSVPKLSETQTVRISIGHLDTLVDLVGELVILRSRLEELSDARVDPALAETIGDLQRISTDLQYEVMQTRMVPVGNIFNRFPRMVRDLAIELGKDIDFDMQGLDIELDRTVLDEIGDPLVHLLRNSIDHGVESPSARAATGKAAVGRITLSAARERDHVAISVSDDGKGIDPERVWAKAVERGIVAESARHEYGNDDILMITCVPGFSTAETATKVSGRGVGMDVVKGKIEHLGGTVEIHSSIGVGTSFILRLPLTLAIVHALLVTSRGQDFALPLSSVEEVIAAEDLNLDTVDGAPVLILRDGVVVPMFRLDVALFGGDSNRMPEPGSNVVLVQSAGELKALHVDAFAGRTEIVVKPLSRLFRDTRGFSGATILGDGRVILILDPRSLFTYQEG